MGNKRMRIFFLFLLTFLTAIAVLFAINRYYYSWAGLVLNKVGLCEYKSVSVLGDNGYPRPMSFRFDTQFIAREMSKNKDYQVNNRYNGNGTVISRNFDGVIYKLYFENRGGTFEGFNVGTGIDNPRFDFPTPGGEKCTTPSYALKSNALTMIDDLPLTDKQKDELRKSVWVIPVINFSLF